MDGVQIAEAARQLRDTAYHSRVLEWYGRIPPIRRNLSGKIYTPFDIALLRRIGVAPKARRLLLAAEVFGGDR